MSKFGNVPTESDGMTFASKKEARRYQELMLLQRAGEIYELTCQPKYELQPAFVDSDGKRHQAITYKPDFLYLVQDDSVTFGYRHVVEEVKGGKATMTQASALRIKLFKFKYPHIRFVLVSE